MADIEAGSSGIKQRASAESRLKPSILVAHHHCRASSSKDPPPKTPTAQLVTNLSTFQTLYVYISICIYIQRQIDNEEGEKRKETHRDRDRERLSQGRFQIGDENSEFETLSPICEQSNHFEKGASLS